ncbi:hypothetical protein [Paenibacillus terrigena]|uniref:hypothetical protein n=1 Tax=Paenibacillus terrigena TaxID=369333 RepID=UPI0028D168D2|nr:hypothetical protein [Paenibacillus terrigena]
MIETLIIYDNAGRIFFQASSNVPEPVGLPFLKLVIPSGKFVSKVDLSRETPEAVLEDIPKTEVELLKDEQELMKKAIEDLILGGAL